MLNQTVEATNCTDHTNKQGLGSESPRTCEVRAGPGSGCNRSRPKEAQETKTEGTGQPAFQSSVHPIPEVAVRETGQALQNRVGVPKLDFHSSMTGLCKSPNREGSPTFSTRHGFP